MSGPANVRVGFSVSKGLHGLFSKLICFISRSQVSHAWLIYWDETFEMDMVLEAHVTGFRIIPRSTFERKSKVIAVYTTEDPLDKGLVEAASLLGESYDFLGLVGMIVVEFGKRLRKRWKNPLRSSRSQFCSESVIRVLNACGYTDLSPDDSSPQDILDFLKVHGKEAE